MSVSVSETRTQVISDFYKLRPGFMTRYTVPCARVTTLWRGTQPHHHPPYHLQCHHNHHLHIIIMRHTVKMVGIGSPSHTIIRPSVQEWVFDPLKPCNQAIQLCISLYSFHNFPIKLVIFHYVYKIFYSQCLKICVCLRLIALVNLPPSFLSILPTRGS